MAGMKMWERFPVWQLSCAAIVLFMTMVSYKADAQSLQDVHRFYKQNKHLFTLSYTEGVNAGFSYEGVGFTAYISPLDSFMTVLYRCYASNRFDHFVSSDPNCEGKTNEGSYGYVSSVPRLGFTALYRFANYNRADHLATKNYSEVNASNGWTYEGILGYVPN